MSNIKVNKELAKILRDVAREVAKWEPWQRSLDPIGKAGALKYGGKKEAI